MNKITILSVSALGATALLGVSFLGFAKLNGVPMHSLPLVGGMFPETQDAEHPKETTEAPPPVDEQKKPATPSAAITPDAPVGDDHAPEDAHATAQKTPATPTVRQREARAGMFEMIGADGLYSQEELRTLGDSLRTKIREVDQRGEELDRREDLISDRLTSLDERRRTLDEFAKQLDLREREAKAREAELNRDQTTNGGAAANKTPAGALSAFFSEGEVEVLVTRLAGFTPDETAQILVKLQPARAKELLDALPTARWRECAEAYARAAQTVP